MMNYIIIGVVRWLQGGPWEGRPGSQDHPAVRQGGRAAEGPGRALRLDHRAGAGRVHARLHATTPSTAMRSPSSASSSQHRPLRRHERRPRHDAHDVPLRRASAAWSGFMRRLRREHDALRRPSPAGVGFTAITVAWLAQLNPFAMIVISVHARHPGQGRARRSRPVWPCPTSICRHHHRHHAVLSCSAASSSSTIRLIFRGVEPKRRRRNVFDIADHLHPRAPSPTARRCCYGTLGEILTEKSGNLNLGVEGIMFMGGALGLGGRVLL